MLSVRFAIILLASTAIDAAADGELAEAIKKADSEEHGRQLMEPHMGAMKDVSPLVIEAVVLRQWWALSRDLIAKGHEQKTDISFAVRKAVKYLKDESDELLRTLNPKYGQALQVAPAFQWAQNDTSIFLTVKYTARWNAPGALEATDVEATFLNNVFNFTGFGKHSNNKYKYFLGLSLFDNIDAERSIWSAASVGRLGVTLRKKWPRKWPRLLDNKKTKITNMHVWSDWQDKQEDSLKGMTTASNSPITCKQMGKLYCLGTDTCKDATKCSLCPGKSTVNEKEHLCAGRPSERASVTFTDADLDEHEIGGEVKITKAKSDFDIDAYTVFFGKDSSTKLTVGEGDNEKPVELGQVETTGADVVFKIPANTVIPAGATQILVFSRNSYGEHDQPGAVFLSDAVQPKDKPTSVSMDDTHGDKGQLEGNVVIGRPAVQDKTDNYVLHWGKTATKRISSSSLISEVSKNGDENPSYKLTSKNIPDGANYILAYSKNHHAEHPTPAAWKIIDNTRPCLNITDSDCPMKVALSPDTDLDANQVSFTITVARAKDEKSVSEYSLYWGKKDCGAGSSIQNLGDTQSKNGLIKNLLITESNSEVIPMDTLKPKGSTHILAIAKNQYGESKNCVSAKFDDVDDTGAAPPPPSDDAAPKTEL